MSKTLNLESALAEKRKVEAEAGRLHADAVQLREKFIAEGIDLSAKANRDQFDQLDAAFRAADEKKSEAQELDVAARRLAEIDGIAGRQPPYGDRKPYAVGDPGERPRSSGLWTPGQRFTMSDAYVQAEKDGAYESADALVQAVIGQRFTPTEILSRDELRSVLSGRGFRSTEITGASSTSAGPFIQNDLQAGYVQYMTKGPRLMNIVGQGATNSDTVEYVTQSAPTNNTDGVAEGAAPSEAVIAFATATAPVEDYTEFIPVSNRSMQDAPFIEGIIGDELLNLLFDTVENDLATGAGSNNNVEGIYTAVSQTTAVGASGRVGALHTAMTQTRTAAGVYMDPDYIGIHPNDYDDLILETDGNGNYLMGPPALAGSRTIWGVPFVVSPVFTSGAPLVGNFGRGAKMWIRQGARVTMGLNSDDFTKRRVTLLVNMRFAFKTIRITAFSEVTGF